MTKRRKLEGESLRTLDLPTGLIEEFLEVDALGLDRPAPTAELVAATLARCEEALEGIGSSTEPAWDPKRAWGPAFAWQRGAPSPIEQFVGALNTCFLTRGVHFAQQKPDESAVLLVDNHSIIDPEEWATEPSLVMLSQVYRGCDRALGAVSGKPIKRMIILKEDVNAYDERDLTVMREAIEEPTTRETYLIAAKYAGSFRKRGCAVIANEIIFEIGKSKNDAIVVKDPGGVQDSEEATKVCREVFDLTRYAFSVYEGDQLNPRLEAALRTKGTAGLRTVLKSIG
jgi:hypothetical protein